MIGGGTGIVPIYTLAKYLLQQPSLNVTLISAHASNQENLLYNELLKLEQDYQDRFKLICLIENGQNNDKHIHKGRVTLDMLKQLPLNPNPIHGEYPTFFICGPPGMLNQICGMKGWKNEWDQGNLSGYLKSLGYNQKAVYKL